MITETHQKNNSVVADQSPASDFTRSLENMASQNVRSGNTTPQVPLPTYTRTATNLSFGTRPPSYTSAAPYSPNYDRPVRISAATRRAHNISSSSLSHKLVAGFTLTSVLAAGITMAVVLSERKDEKQ